MGERVRAVALGLLMLATLGACSHASPGTAEAAAAGPAATTTTVGPDPSAPPATTACTGRKAGKDGVTHLFCDGQASIGISVGTTVTSMQRGSCNSSGSLITVNAGVAVDSERAGSSIPDFISIDVPSTGGPVDRLDAWLGDRHPRISTARATVSANKKRIHVSGSTVQGVALAVDIAC